ncbi:MAG: hypothetical protein EOO71_07140 [Myxococcaceae bacterium]|nr:MAG: hypothetical protein EOO71_07140 [Myxococcaceae bacterium]
MRRAPAAAARWLCLLMLASGRVGAAEPEAPQPSAPAPVQVEPTAPAVEPVKAPEPEPVKAPEARAEESEEATVWGEESLMQADFPPEMKKAADALTQDPQVLCAGGLAQTHEPGLLLVTNRDTRVGEHLLSITCPISDGVVMTTVSTEVRSLKGATCLTKPEGPTAATVGWSNGESSVLELKDVEATVECDMRVLTSRGIVKSGRHQGHAVTLSTAVPMTATLAACMQESGLTASTGVATLTLTAP